MLETTLPEDFYKTEGWQENLVNFYGNKKDLLPPDLLQNPIKLLTEAIYDVSYIYGNFPEVVYNALGQCTDPLFEPEEYHKEIYTVLKKAGEDEDRPLLITYAEGLLTIRLLFSCDREFYDENFTAEIKKAPGKDDESRHQKFISEIQSITKIHVNQVRRMISERKE